MLTKKCINKDKSNSVEQNVVELQKKECICDKKVYNNNKSNALKKKGNLQTSFLELKK